MRQTHLPTVLRGPQYPLTVYAPSRVHDSYVVAYGLHWPSASRWIVPGTSDAKDCGSDGYLDYDPMPYELRIRADWAKKGFLLREVSELRDDSDAEDSSA